MSDGDSASGPSNKYVAFCDILGFSSQVQDNFDQALENYDAFLSFITERGLFRNVELCIYSDAVLITSDRFDEVVTAINNLWFFAFQHNFLIRGGISYGRYWERRSNGHFFVVSDALIRAVKLESSAKYPMVVIDDNIEIPIEAWIYRFQNGLSHCPILHYEGRNIVNPFHPFYFRSVGGRVQHMKDLTGRAPEKYDWLIALHASAWADNILVPDDAVSKLLELGIIGRKDEAATETKDASDLPPT